MFADVETEQRAEDGFVSLLGTVQARIGTQERELLRLIAQADTQETWLEWGAHNYVHWLSMRVGVSAWKAQRLIAASTALEHLPFISEALVSGRLSLDKVMELTRFATAKDEEELIEWAGRGFRSRHPASRGRRDQEPHHADGGGRGEPLGELVALPRRPLQALSRAARGPGGDGGPRPGPGSRVPARDAG